MFLYYFFKKWILLFLCEKTKPLPQCVWLASWEGGKGMHSQDQRNKGLNGQHFSSSVWWQTHGVFYLQARIVYRILETVTQLPDTQIEGSPVGFTGIAIAEWIIQHLCSYPQALEQNPARTQKQPRKYPPL